MTVAIEFTCSVAFSRHSLRRSHVRQRCERDTSSREKLNYYKVSILHGLCIAGPGMPSILRDDVLLSLLLDLQAAAACLPVLIEGPSTGRVRDKR
jgi:hypothetical protein